MVTLNGLQQVKLDAPINGDFLVVISAIRLAAELGISHAQLAAPTTNTHTPYSAIHVSYTNFEYALLSPSKVKTSALVCSATPSKGLSKVT